jgi:uncharacterized protein YecE (DUF72 family)
MERLYAGTSGWAYAAWKPEFYPPKTPPKKFLAYYASRLNTVEVNFTFRRRLTAAIAQSWIATTPANFLFSFKAHQAITHYKRLRDSRESVMGFLQSLDPFRETARLGVVLFQLPPNLKADGALLDEFLAGLPGNYRFAIEFRHPSWFDNGFFARMRERNVALCVAESEKLVAPDVETADFAYYRFRQGEYTPTQRRTLAARVTQARGEVFVYFKHEESAAGALYAEELLRRVRESRAA